MRRFRILAGLALAAICLFSCNKPGGETPGGKTPDIEKGEHLADITYQVNVYSFADSDGDGWGDLKGVTQHLDYFESLGVSALWLSPVQTSMSYHGYDVTDYTAINPKFGTEADFKDLISKAKAKGIGIYMDYVLNHSGSGHGWFTQACADPSSPYRDYYVFSNTPSGYDNGGMGGWHALSSASGRMHFKLDWNAKTVTVTNTDAAAQKSNASATIWLYYGDGVLMGLYETGSGVFEITVDFASSWGFLIRTSTTSWDGGTKWGGDGSALKLGTAYKINNSSAKDIGFAGGSYYFASFDKSMPDFNYGPADKAAESGAFKDLAASADKWIKMGISGLRLDAVLWIYQNKTADNVKFLKAWYDHCNATWKANGGQGDFYMVGEAWTDDAQSMAPYYQGLPSCFNFPFWWTLKDRIGKAKGDDFAKTVLFFRNLFQAQRPGFIDAIKLSNHDEDRTAEDLGKSLEKEKLAAAVLLTSPGKPFIYQGEELGYWGNKGRGDEYVRAPIKWAREGSVPSAALGGKVDNAMLSADISVEAQATDGASLLNVYRAFAQARNTYKALAHGEMQEVRSSNNSVALWTMSYEGQTVLVAHNFGAGIVSVNVPDVSDGQLLVYNGAVTANGSSLTLGAYASAVFAQ